MAIKLAFSNTAAADWSIEQVAEKAAAMGYQGVELRTLGSGDGTLASDPALTSPDKVVAALSSHNIEPVCLSTSVVMHHRDTTKLHQQRKALHAQIDLAARIGCSRVRLFGNAVMPGLSRHEVINQIAANVKPSVAYAADQGVQLLFENSGSFNAPKEWWWLFNQVDHPMLGMCWNLANSAAADSDDVGGWRSVSMLNSRIRLAKVQDTVLGSGGGFVPLGEGTVGIENFIKRLMGIGFDSYVIVEWNRLWLPALEEADTYLPAAREKLTAWIEQIAKLMQDGLAAAEKAAKKTAPKPVLS